MGLRKIACPLALLFAATSVSPAVTATATSQFNVRITITAECLVTSATDLDFGTRGVLAANYDATNTISVQCTNTLPYTVGLGPGNGSGATVTNRLMTAATGTATVGYSIYRDAARTLVWGTAVGATVAGTGNGAVQTITAYGRVPPQSTPAAAVYSDIVAVTVTY